MQSDTFFAPYGETTLTDDELHPSVDSRNFSYGFATDSLEAYLINEGAVTELILDKPVGTPIGAFDGHPAGRIVKDFYYRSLH